MRLLCSEPYNYRPWEIGRLVPFQVQRVLLVSRDRKGCVVLDPPLADDVGGEITMEDEYRDYFRGIGVTDPDALARLVAAKLNTPEVIVWDEEG